MISRCHCRQIESHQRAFCGAHFIKIIVAIRLRCVIKALVGIWKNFWNTYICSICCITANISQDLDSEIFKLRRASPEEQGELKGKKILQEAIIRAIKRKFLFPFFMTDRKELQDTCCINSLNVMFGNKHRNLAQLKQYCKTCSLLKTLISVLLHK